jgi:hypothetical protein
VISALLFVAKPWRRVGWKRTLGAILVLIAADISVGLVVAAILGAQAGSLGIVAPKPKPASGVS